jgi:hypothetical protein
MTKSKINGLIGKDGISGLVGKIVHHTSGNKLAAMAIYALSQGRDVEKEMEYRGNMLETDMTTLNSGLQEVLKIAEQKGYTDIVEMLTKKEYEHGHDWPDKN